MSNPSDHEPKAPPAPQNVPPVRARQGMLGAPVLMVLVAALILAAIAWWAAELFGASIAPPESQQIGDPQSVDVPGQTAPAQPPSN